MDWLKNKGKKVKNLVTKDKEKRLTNALKKIDSAIVSQSLIITQLQERKDSAGKRREDESKAGNKISAELALKEEILTENRIIELGKRVEELLQQRDLQRDLIESGQSAIQIQKVLKASTADLQKSTKGLRVDKIEALLDRQNKHKELIHTVNDVMGGTSEQDEQDLVKELAALKIEVEMKDMEEKLKQGDLEENVENVEEGDGSESIPTLC